MSGPFDRLTGNQSRADVLAVERTCTYVIYFGGYLSMATTTDGHNPG